MTLAPCPTHGSTYRALHEHNFRGIVEVIDNIILTISGVVGTTSYSRCPVGYPWNFEGIVRALEDLNTTVSGIQGGGGGSASGIVGGSGIYITESGVFQVVNASVTGASGIIYTAGSGLYLSDGGTRFNANYDAIFQNSVSGHLIPQGSVSITYSGNYALLSGTVSAGGGGASVTVSGAPAAGYSTGALWFDTNEGRLFVYASGNGVSSPAWYQTNAEALALKGEQPPSGVGLNAPPRDGLIWFNTLLGSLFVYDAVTSGWYETGPSRSFAYGSSAPPPSTQGAGWFDSSVNRLKVWNGSTWADIDVDGGVY